MVFFITFLRALAACFITNSHYEGIYPTDIIANGGLLGDILFFAVSGYCLYNIKTNFFRWYGKRIYRCYLPVITITLVYMLIGFYKYSDHPLNWWFIYPTNFHFIASIILLYIPFYFIIKIDALKKRIPLVMAIIGIGAVIYYIFAYDKSVYHIDSVHEPFIRVLFMECMLIGAYFKQNDQKFRNRFSIWVPILLVIFFPAYFASKLFFQKYVSYAEFQIVNQFIIVVVLYLIFRLFASLDQKVTNLPKGVKAPITFIADMTLEIYVVQSPLIKLLKDVGAFPLNWFSITAAIIASAFALHLFCKYFMKLSDFLILKIKTIFSSPKTNEKTKA